MNTTEEFESETLREVYMHHQQPSLHLYLSQLASEGVSVDDQKKEMELIAEVRKENPGAREKLILYHLWSVVKISGRFLDRGLARIDLIMEGNRGLIQAIDEIHKYDMQRAKFITFAGSNYIEPQIKTALARQSSTLHIPKDKVYLRKKIDRVSERLFYKLERMPTNKEIASELGVSPKLVKRLVNTFGPLQSLDAELDESESHTLMDTIPSEEASPDTVAMQRETPCLNDIVSVLGVLGSREKEVLCLRFGLLGRSRKIFKQIAIEWGVTKSRIQQIEDEAIKKIRCEFRRRALSLNSI